MSHYGLRASFSNLPPLDPATGRDNWPQMRVYRFAHLASAVLYTDKWLGLFSAVWGWIRLQSCRDETEGVDAFLHLYTLHSSAYGFSPHSHPCNLPPFFPHRPSPLTPSLFLPPTPVFLSLPLSSLRCLFRFISGVPVPLVNSRALSPSRGGSNLLERVKPHFWMRWHPPWRSWREVRCSRMRCRAHVGLPTV